MEDALFDKIVESTGLPEELISQDFLKKIKEMGFQKENLTLEEIRDVLTEYLQEVILKAREEFR